MENPNTVVFGIDGANFELIEPWLDKGELPNIHRVIKTGISGDLESVLPPVTSPNWKAYSTGKNPGKIGIFWWENIDTKNSRVYYPSERKHQNTEFWEIIAEEEDVGVFGVPTTYPPKEVDAFLVAGPPDGENTGYAYPKEVEQILKDEFDYRLNKQLRLKDNKEAAAEEILNLIDLRFQAAKRLLQEHDVAFLQITTFYINALHHFLWNDEYTLKGWQIIDEHVGYFLEDERNILLMSDHGSNEINTVFHINPWLEREGYLYLDTTIPDLLRSLGVNLDRLIRIASKIRVRDSIERFAPQRLLRIVERLPNEQGDITRESKTGYIDWARSTAIASGQGPIYLTLDSSDPGYARFRDELVEKFRKLTAPDGRPIAKEVFLRKNVYSGKFVDEAPDLVIDGAPGIHINGSIGRNAIFTDPSEDGWRAENKRAGLFAATGPDFNSGKISDLSILDLAPTLLHLHSCPIPEDMDGGVEKSLFAEGCDARKREPVFRPPDGDRKTAQHRKMDEELSNRLSDLGYFE